MEGIARKLRSAGLKAQTRVEVSDARAGVVDYAEEMGRRPHRRRLARTDHGIQRFLMGSVSESGGGSVVEIVRRGRANS